MLSPFFAKKSTRVLCLVELCKNNPIATGNGVSSCLECLVGASTFRLFVFNALNFNNWPILLAMSLVANDLLEHPSINSSINCCKQKGMDSFCFSLDKSPSKLVEFENSSALMICAAFASIKLFSEHEFSHASNKAFPTSPSRIYFDLSCFHIILE